MDKKKISLPIIVEGKYDKNTILQIFDATVITTSGFSIFNSKEKQALLRKLAEPGGVILLTDSDGGGRQIRSFVMGILPKDRVYNLFIPQKQGKERRKKSPSKAGLLGVEGMGREVLEKLLSPFVSPEKCSIIACSEKKMLTKLDFYNDGFSGGENSSAFRDSLSNCLELPTGMTAKSMIEAINILYTYEEYKEAADRAKAMCLK